MDFLILTASSLIAIAFLSFLAAKLYPAPAGLTPERAQRNMLRYEPDAEIASIFLSADKQVALVELAAPADTLGLLRQLGDRVVCRLVQRHEIETVRWQNDSLTLSFDDFTQPQISLIYAPEQRENLEAVVATILPQPETADAA